MDLDFLQQIQQEEEHRRSQEEAEKRKRKKEERGNNDNNDNNGSLGLLATLGVIFILIIILASIGSIGESEDSNTALNNMTTEIEENITTDLNVITDLNINHTIDYEEKEFENELNDGNLEMIGKIVRFSVKEYHPESAFGDNCWSGEHLNFISEENANANTGDIIIGKITEKPYKFLGCWIVHYELISSDASTKNEINNVENNI